MMYKPGFFIAWLILSISTASYAQTITYTHSPRHLQFFTRDSQDSSAVPLSGTISTTGYDSVYIKLYKSVGAITGLIKTAGSGLLAYTGGSASFNLNVKIHSELAEYKLEFYAAPRGSLPPSHILVKTIDSLVCGDAFLIAGQSNSHPASPLATYQNEYCRTLGIQTPNSNYNTYDAKDTLWSYANGHGFGADLSGPYLVGVWGIRLMQYLKDSFNIPVCIINGGAGGTTIQENLPSANHTALNNIYGKLFYRVQKAGLQNIRAIFWYQGEADQNIDTSIYSLKFNTLYNAWKADYPTVNKIYVMQLHQGCTGSDIASGKFREFQRTLSNRYHDIRTISTMNIPGHEGCHYSKTGYDSLSYRLFRAVAKDFYNSTVITDIYAPDITHVYYANAYKKIIHLQFSNSTNLSLTSYPARNIKDYFFLDDVSGNIDQVSAQGNRATIKLVSLTAANMLTYLPGTYYNNTTTYYQGPYIINSLNIGALSFYGKIIETNTSYDVPVANFGYDLAQAYAGNPIPLIDSSLEWPSTFTWSAPGGIISADNIANPTVTYSNPGTYLVTLNVTNSYGSSAASTISTLVTVVSAPALPLRLTHFALTKKDCAVSLNWETADESNTRSFDVEQSVDGNDFRKVTNVSAKGKENNTYGIVISQLSAMMHYRLRMIDIDLKYTYSPVKTFVQDCVSARTSLISYPNPAKSSSALVFTYMYNTSNSNAFISLTDLNGKNLWKSAVQVKAGSNIYKMPDLKLPAGVYFVQLISNSWKTDIQKIAILP